MIQDESSLGGYAYEYESNQKESSTSDSHRFYPGFFLCILPMTQNTALGEEQTPIQLSKTQTTGNPLMQLLAKRSSSREFSSKPLPVTFFKYALGSVWNQSSGVWQTDALLQVSAGDRHICCDGCGLYLYDAKSNLLKPILAEDIED